MSATFSRTAEVSLIYKLEGDLQDIDVFQLAPALLGLGELIQESNRALNKDKEEVAVRVRPFSPGSFTVDVVLFAHLAMGALPFVTEDRIQRVKEIVRSVKGAVDLIKELKGKKEKGEEIQPGEFRYQSENRTVTVGGDVHKLVQNQTIVNNVTKVYATPASAEGVTEIRSFIRGEEQDALVVTKEEAPYLAQFAAPAVDLDPEQPLESVEIALVSPKSGSYGGKGGHFWFTRGAESFPAKLEDKNFLTRFETGQIRLHYTDVLKVQMAVSQTVENEKVSVSRHIIEVLDYKPGTHHGG